MDAPQESETLEERIVSSIVPADAQISPDGRFVVWTATPASQSGEHPEGSLWLASLDHLDNTARPFTSGKGRDFHPRWSPSSDVIAFLSDRENRGVHGLYTISLNGGEATSLLRSKRSIESFVWSPDGRSIALALPDDSSAEEERRKESGDDAEVYGENWPYARLRILDVASRDVRLIDIGERHVFNIAWSPDGNRLALLVSPSPELETRVQSEIVIVEVSTGEFTDLAGARGRAAGMLTWSGDGESLIYYGSHDALPQSSATVIAVDVRSGEQKWTVPTQTDSACANGLAGAGTSTRIIISTARGLATRFEWCDQTTGDREPILDLDDAEVGSAFTAAEFDGNSKIALVRSSGTEPPEVYAGHPNSFRQISNHNRQLRDFDFGITEAFTWQSHDGLELDGVLIRPSGGGDSPRPLVVLPHGGPYGRNVLGWNLGATRWGMWLAAHGIATLMPNYRGGMGHGDSFAQMARGEVGEGDHQDVMTAVDAAIGRGIADPDRLGIGGWSQGGFHTAWAVTQTNRFRAGVMGAGVSDWGMMSMTSDVPTFESVLAGDRPWDGTGPHNAARLSPISYARNVKTPLLILHGQQDQRVPVSQAIGFERAIRENGGFVKLVTYPREPHGIRERAHQIDILRRVRDWFQHYLLDA